MPILRYAVRVRASVWSGVYFRRRLFTESSPCNVLRDRCLSAPVSSFFSCFVSSSSVPLYHSSTCPFRRWEGCFRRKVLSPSHAKASTFCLDAFCCIPSAQLTLLAHSSYGLSVSCQPNKGGNTKDAKHPSASSLYAFLLSPLGLRLPSLQSAPYVGKVSSLQHTVQMLVYSPRTCPVHPLFSG